MRFVVTGYCGYVGQVLAARLLAAGHDVFGLDSNLYSRCSLAGEEEPQISAQQCDIRARRGACSALCP